MDCLAVGFYRPAAFGLQATSAPPTYPLIETYNGRSWQIAASPAVAPNSVLVSVSCSGIAACTAVGYTTASDDQNPVESFFAEDFDGSSWAVASLVPTAGTSSGLNSVSCPDSSTCVAVGYTAPLSDATSTRPLVEVLADGRWSRAALPSDGTNAGILYGVTCRSADNCVAVGDAATVHTSGSALVLSLSGSTWSVNSTALGQPGDLSLTALGCGDTECLVAGSALDSGQKILARTDATDWQPLTVPDESDNIQGIGCVGPSRCVVVGSGYVNNFGNTMTLIASLSGSSWNAQQSPVP